MDRALLLLCAALTAGCSKEAPATTPRPAAKADAGAASLDPMFALQSIVARPPPPDGTYLVDAIVVHVNVCRCPPGTRCDCVPDSVDVTNDVADSASWSLRVRGIDDIDRRFKVGARYRLVARVEHGEPAIVDATAR